MCRSFLMLLLFSLIVSCEAQPRVGQKRTINPDFDQKVESVLDFSIPIITVDSLQPRIGEYILLDAREIEEYEVSHIPGAQYIGHRNAEPQSLGLSKDTPIVVYCSIGYRSEKIGLSLIEDGYSQVFNLYGSIFEWVNQGNAVVDMKGDTTNRIHTYNKKWSQWVDNEELLKVW